jgi:hypothetical protein
MKLSKLKIATIATIALAFSLVLILPFQVKASGSAYSVAFIYASDYNSALEYQNFLSSYGITVNLVTNSSAATQDYSTYNLIIIGYDTASAGSSYLPAAAVSAINGSGKPILGIGDGGSVFFGNLGLSIGYENSMGEGDNETYVVDVTSPIFSQPISINMPPDGIIQLYISSYLCFGVYVPSPIAGVTLLGEDVPSSAHYPLIMEGTRYFLWGWEPSPSFMTQTGKNLFANIISYLTGDTAIPEFSALSIWLLTFFFATIVAVVATKRLKVFQYKRAH